MRFFILGLFFFCALPAHAGVQVTAIEGNRELVSIRRNGQPLEVRELLPLQENDVITVEREGAGVLLDLDQGKTLRITHENSPYLVRAQKKKNRLLANLAGWIDGLYAGTAHQTETVSLSARGEGRPVMLEGMDLRDNIIPNSVARLVFCWSGGDQPYTVTVFSGETDAVVYRAQTDRQEHTISSEQLPPGEYVVEVTAKNGKTISIDRQYFTLVPPDAVPDELARLEQMLEQENHQLHAAGLATIPEFRFYALQIAKANSDNILVRALLSGQAPEMP